MPNEEIIKLADELKAAREKAEISLQHIASKSRIDLKFLKAIEEGNFEILPEVYIRAFLKEYADLCGLDPLKTLEKYDLAKKGKPIEAASIKSSEEENKNRQSEQKKHFTDETISGDTASDSQQGRNKILLFAAVGLLFIVIIVSYFLFFKNSTPEFVVEKPFEEVLNQQSKRFKIDSNETTQISGVQSDSLVVGIKANDTCWVNVRIDEIVDKEFMLYRNSSIIIKAAAKFDFIVGNSGGISIELNGQQLPMIGTKGQRKVFSINKDGLINSSN